MNGQPWQRMEDVINYEAIVKSIHCYVRLEMRRSHRRCGLWNISKKSYIRKILIPSFFYFDLPSHLLIEIHRYTG